MSIDEGFKHVKRWTLPKFYSGERWDDYYSAGVGQSRDSDALERSNFAKMLEALGGESETVLVVREGHFLVGWVEWIAISDGDIPRAKIADDILAALEDYPVIDEEHFSEVEHEEAGEVWRECYDPQERIAHIREHRSEFDFRDFADLIGCVRGKYYAGYPCSILN